MRCDVWSNKAELKKYYWHHNPGRNLDSKVCSDDCTISARNPNFDFPCDTARRRKSRSRIENGRKQSRSMYKQPVRSATNREYSRRMNERSERGAEGSESKRNRNRSRGRVIRAGRRLKGMEGLQVSFLAGVAEEVGEALLLDAPQDAAHHRRHGCRRHDDSPAGPKRKRGGAVETGNCGSGRFVRPMDGNGAIPAGDLQNVLLPARVKSPRCHPRPRSRGRICPRPRPRTGIR